ncbi:hypothetical protein ZEAMMB73_Zm00001d022589 [Zea mays]|uniref:Uncharacterized protein n=1 Tax=Zea mays TaxID=4577 RepID=A0A1D6LKK2_MAIZE|nr:hypothetical protein ZEAMMB73_Zm00001d049053 [Zea mays]AQK80237.1 hypothetical protein ZEAMMB73_Zm00001d036060 [Zea mays]ONM61166.1 hypothetical protein ZEAMMB73_Zm00001d022589 [Zea mays]
MEGVSPIAASSLANRVRHGNTGEAVGSLVDAHHGETNGGKGKGYIFHPGRMWRGSSNSVTLIRLLVALQLSLMLCLCLIVAVRIWLLLVSAMGLLSILY